MGEPTEDDTEGHAKRFFAKPDDEATEREAPSTTDEDGAEDDTEGHRYGQRPDRDVTAPRGTDERPAPPQKKE